MAKLYFRYGVMGSSKTANALMVRYNYEERGQDALLVKPAVDQRDGARFVASRAGLSHPCIYFSDLMEMTPRQLKPYACIIVDEAPSSATACAPTSRGSCSPARRSCWPRRT